MKLLRDCFGPSFALVLTTLLAGCASTSPPLPPSLELPKPPTDLRAMRKADRVYLTWSVPTLTTDRQAVRYLGATRICRTLETVMTQCGNPVGESPAPPIPPRAADKKKPSSTTQILQASYTDTLSPQLQQQNPTAMLTYAVEVLNSSNRGAGLSNQAKVAAAPTLPPPEGFTAKLTGEGVVLSWKGAADGQQLFVDLIWAPDTDADLAGYNIYRHEEGGKAVKINSDLVKTPAYRDARVAQGKKYFYSVSAIDLRGNESARSEETSETVP